MRILVVVMLVGCADEVDPRAQLCTDFNSAEFSWNGTACSFTVDDIDWTIFEDSLTNEEHPEVAPGWSCDVNGCAGTSSGIRKVASETFVTGASRWTKEGGALGVAVFVGTYERTDVRKQLCVWKRCL
jgi:hypothetical protein